MQFSSHCVTSIFTYPSISTTHFVKLNLICPHSMHCDKLLVWDKYFCIFLQGFNFKICCSLSKCQMLDNSIHPMLPSLPMVTPLAGLLLWRGTSSAAHPAILWGPAEAAKGQKSWTQPEEGRKLFSLLETPRLFPSACRYGYSDPWALFWLD